jgi:hypothetical protein
MLAQTTGAYKACGIDFEAPGARATVDRSGYRNYVFAIARCLKPVRIREDNFRPENLRVPPI